MNILIFIPDVPQDSGGLRQYSAALIKILTEETSNSYYLYNNTNDQLIQQIINQNNFNIKLVKDVDIPFRVVTDLWFKFQKLVNFFLKNLKIKIILKPSSNFDRLCTKYKIDVVHCPYQYIPETSKAKLITTMHDVQELYYPEFFSPKERANRAINKLDFITRANKVVVSYNHVKKDLINFFNLPPEKIHVILLDMGKLWFEGLSEEDMVNLSEYPQQYLLYPANTWKHKNHIRLIKAIALLRDKYNLKVNLLCTGHLNDHFHSTIRVLLEEQQLQNQITFTGIIDEKKLFSLYKSALGVVVPTLYEAGSFPLIESILLKAPVICSKVTSLPDTIKNDRFLFNPTDINEMAERIKTLWENEEFRKESLKNSEKVKGALMNNQAKSLLKELYCDLK